MIKTLSLGSLFQCTMFSKMLSRSYLRAAFLFKALVIGISFSQGKVKLGRVNGEFESADSKLLDKCSQI